jgi:hypothetical protein
VIYFVGSNSTPTINGQRTITRITDDTFSVPVNVTIAGTAGEWLSTNEYQIVTDVGLDYTTMLLDWQHLRGRSSHFAFVKNAYDGSSRLTSKLSYAAGAKAGSMGNKTLYTYTGAATVPTTELEIPYVLTTADLLTP